MAEAPYLTFKWLFDPYTVLPIQMFNWVSRPQEEFPCECRSGGDGFTNDDIITEYCGDSDSLSFPQEI